MRSVFFAAALGCLTACASLPAAAAEPMDIHSIHYDSQTSVGSHALTLNGAGLRKKLFFKVYAAGLYVPQTSNDSSALVAQPGATRVRLGLLRDVSGASFISALDDGLKANLSESTARDIAAELEALRTLMRNIGDVKTGDLVDFDFVPETGTVVLLNGNPVGESIGGGRTLYNAVLAIWLGPKAIDESLKAGMLGGK